MNPCEVIRGNSPIILGLPHTGTHVPEHIFVNLTPLGKTLGDTDWHIHKLYDGLFDGATSVRATFHRYVIDANRNPTNESLYPGQNTTGLVPTTNFDGDKLWASEPTTADISERLTAFHQPYHLALREEITRIKDMHGVAILFDCHSIRSNIPYLFEGTLPDFNVGTDGGKSCAKEVEQIVESTCSAADGYSSVLNGRFKGGWTTRNYGQPQQNIHAIQLEIAQTTHLSVETPPFDYDQKRAARLQIHLKTILEKLAVLAPSLGAIS